FLCVLGHSHAPAATCRAPSGTGATNKNGPEGPSRRIGGCRTYFLAPFFAAGFFAGLAAAFSALRLAALGSTAALKAAPGTNFGTFWAAILIFSPACGLKPVRAARATCLKVPKPTSDTLSPFFT